MLCNAMPEAQGVPWFVLHTLSNHENVVAAHLEGREVEHYFPSYQLIRMRTDRKVTLDLPLFPGYVFARFAPRQQLSVLTVPGMLRILEVPGGLATVTDAELLRLREGLLHNLKMLPSVPFNAGDRVRILRGPFQGYAAFVAESKTQFMRVVMAIGNITNCSFSLDVAPSDLELISNYQKLHSINHSNSV